MRPAVTAGRRARLGAVAATVALLGVILWQIQSEWSNAIGGCQQS